MAETNPNPGKAQLLELDESFAVLDGGRRVTVQFNPDSLKLSFANQIQNKNPSTTPSGGTDQGAGSAGQQFLGSGTTKLTVQLWFDANAGAGGEKVDDVRRLTQQVIFFITSRPSKKDSSRVIPPGVRFWWGSFIFDGLIESIEETIDFFSPDGRALRASMSLGMTQQNILVASFDNSSVPGSAAARTPGSTPMTPAAAGSTLQGLAAQANADWQSIAAANGIDNPRQLVPGQLIDLAARVPRSLF